MLVNYPDSEADNGSDIGSYKVLDTPSPPPSDSVAVDDPATGFVHDNIKEAREQLIKTRAKNATQYNRRHRTTPIQLF